MLLKFEIMAMPVSVRTQFLHFANIDIYCTTSILLHSVIEMLKRFVPILFVPTDKEINNYTTLIEKY